MSSTELVQRHAELVQRDPEAEVEWASRCARALVGAIKSNPQLVARISNKDYIKAEGWQTLGAMTKVDHIDVVWCREYTPPGGDTHTGWEVRVEVRDRDGNVRGTGEAMCLRSETRWKSADEFAIRSMAQTRALGKAYRMALSYVVALAGYEPTPAEEMPAFIPEAPAPKVTAAQQKTLDALVERCAGLQPTNGKGEAYNWVSMTERLIREDGPAAAIARLEKFALEIEATLEEPGVES